MGIVSSIVSAIFGTKKKSKADVESELAAIGKERGLDPLHSIVDLQRALNLDASMTSRRAAWVESGGKAEEYEGTGEQNQKLHAYVMGEVAKGYIDVPDKG